MMRCASVILLVFLAHFGSAQATLPFGFVRQLIAEGLDPVAMTQAPDGRLFLAQKNGTISIVRDDKMLELPFATLEVDNFNERGLSGIALHPDFESNHFVYVFYTVQGLNINRISRLTANGDRAIPGSEEVLFETDELRASIHNAGAMFFDNEGYLFVSTGDGSKSTQAESLQSALGKILRLNDDGSIPTDNPYYDQLSGNARAIWASGFRNPFTMSYDRQNDVFYANDVGNVAWEEINKIERGGFYGWDRLEGPLDTEEVPSNYVEPFYAYSHGQGCAITGSAIYQPESPRFPDSYIGKYFFADYCDGWVKVLDLESGDVQETFMTGADRVVDLHTGLDGSMYYLERRGLRDGSPEDNSSTIDGMLWKIIYTGDGSPFISRQPKDVLAVVGEDAYYEIDVTGDGNLEYAWFINGIKADSDEEKLTLENVLAVDSGSVIVCQITNAQGSVFSDTAMLYVTTNRRPEIEFLKPSANFTYRAGESLSFEATVTDPEDGEVPPTDVKWWVDFHHLDHTHPGVELTSGQPRGTFDIPALGELDTEVWYRIYVNAKDSRGLERTAFLDVYPKLVSFELTSQPEGVRINVDGEQMTTPARVESVAGVQRTLVAPANQIIGDEIYFFEGWDNLDESPLQTIEAGNGPSAMVATYRVRDIGHGTGLLGSYFTNKDFEGLPFAQRIDTTINFLFFRNPPIDGMSEDHFSIRWEGFILPYESANYNFIALVNDGIKVWIDDQLVVESEDIQSSVSLAGGSYFMEGDQLHKIRVEFFEYNWFASCELYWSADGLEQEIIPKSQLFPGENSISATISPNPVRGNQVRLRVESTYPIDATGEIMDMAGRTVSTFRVRTQDPVESVPLQIPELVPGVYYCRLQPKFGEVITVKFIAQ